MATSLDTFGSHDMFVHGAVMATPGAGLVVLEGRLCKKSKWRGKWRVRRFELLQTKQIRVFLGPKLRATFDVSSPLAGVRQINTPGYGRKFEIRDSTSKVIQLEAANVETRDLWCASIQRVIVGQLASSPPPPNFGGGGGGMGMGMGGDANMGHIDVVVPPGMPYGGAPLEVRLPDGRVLHVPVPPGCPPGTLLKVPLPPPPQPLQPPQSLPPQPQPPLLPPTPAVPIGPGEVPVAVMVDTQNGWMHASPTGTSASAVAPVAAAADADENGDDDEPTRRPSRFAKGDKASFMQVSGASEKQAENYMVMTDGDVDSALTLFNEMETAEKF